MKTTDTMEGLPSNTAQLIETAGKPVRLFPSAREGAPLVVLHTVQDEGESVWRAVRSITGTAFTLAAIGGLRWNDEMSPWPSPPIFKGDAPCTGGANAYLGTLTETIVPGILERLPGKPACLALAGYSLAGLFAVYALYRTGMFSRVASASGSFWYPDFLAFAQTHAMAKPPECAYFSLGDKEAKTRNRILQTVEENTRALHQLYSQAGITTRFEMNPGNHFQNAPERMAKGIAWVLEG